MFEDFISKDFTYAIVGASNNPTKYGHRILKDLSSAGFKVIPVNLKENIILGLDAYPSLFALLKDNQIDLDKFVVDFVIPPEAVVEVLKEVKKLNIQKIWMQPGSESQDAIDYCLENSINCVYDHCIMVERRNLGL